MRHGTIILTRAEAADSIEECHARLRTAQACMHAYGAIAEFNFQHSPDDFSFTFKLHQAAAHLAIQAILNGHPASDNDLWVERMVRCDAVREIR